MNDILDLDTCPRCGLEQTSDERGGYFRYWIGDGACFGQCKKCGWMPELEKKEKDIEKMRGLLTEAAALSGAPYEKWRDWLKASIRFRHPDSQKKE